MATLFHHAPNHWHFSRAHTLLHPVLISGEHVYLLLRVCVWKSSQSMIDWIGSVIGKWFVVCWYQDVVLLSVVWYIYTPYNVLPMLQAYIIIMTLASSLVSKTSYVMVVMYVQEERGKVTHNHMCSIKIIAMFDICLRIRHHDMTCGNKNDMLDALTLYNWDTIIVKHLLSNRLIAYTHGLYHMMCIMPFFI